MAPRNSAKVSASAVDSDESTSSSSESSSSNDGMRSKPSKMSKKNVAMDKNSEEYRKRRERNNLAVKKSRSKSKQKTLQTLERVNQLRAENEALEAKVKLLSKELSFLKDLFLAHAGNAHGLNVDVNELNGNNPSGFDTAPVPCLVNNKALHNDHEYSLSPGIKVEA